MVQKAKKSTVNYAPVTCSPSTLLFWKASPSLSEHIFMPIQSFDSSQWLLNFSFLPYFLFPLYTIRHYIYYKKGEFFFFSWFFMKSIIDLLFFHIFFIKMTHKLTHQINIKMEGKKWSIIMINYCVKRKSKQVYIKPSTYVEKLDMRVQLHHKSKRIEWLRVRMYRAYVRSSSLKYFLVDILVLFVR